MLLRNSDFLLSSCPSDGYVSRGMWAFLWVFLGSLLCAGLLCPWVYRAVLYWQELAPNQLNTYLAGKELPDYFDRLRWLFVLMGLPWLFRVCGFRWRDLGWANLADWRPILVRCFLLGFALVLFLLIGQAVLFDFGFKEGLHSRWLSVMGRALGGAIAVALLEEFVFRGLLLRIFYSALSPVCAVLLLSLFFAYVHFKMPDDIWLQAPEVVGSTTGLWVAWWTLVGITVDFQGLPFLNLVVLGVVLALLALRYGSLWPAVGFHAGIVFVMLLAKNSFIISGSGSIWWGSMRLTDGLLCTVLLSLVMLYLLLTHGRQRG